MPHPNSGTLDLRCGPSRLLPPSPAARPHAPRLARRAGEIAGALFTRFLAWRAQRMTLRLLSSLDAATLRDLGITDIESAVYSASQDPTRSYDPDWWRTT
jgi:uncharacterized protein YjiS (DUF1127 family)